MLSQHILRDIREAIGIEPNDPKQDDYILKTLGPDERFELWCQWNGLLGWSDKLKEVVLEIFKEEK